MIDLEQLADVRAVAEALPAIDGCARPFLARGQDTLFTRGYNAEIWDGVNTTPTSSSQTGRSRG